MLMIMVVLFTLFPKFSESYVLAALCNSANGVKPV